MEKPPGYKLPKTMQQKTLDLKQAPKDNSPSVNPFHNQTAPPASKPPQKPSKWKTIALIIVIILCIASAVYLVFLLLAPKLLSTKSNTVNHTAAKKDEENRIQIESVGIDSPIIEGDVNSLEKGAWHRLPKQGDPTKGGNFIVTGHSFVWGYTPQQIKDKSIFFTLPDVKKDDKITVKWSGKDYTYKVIDVKKVTPNQIDVENQTKDATLTVYTCSIAGQSDGRIVVIAKPA